MNAPRSGRFCPLGCATYYVPGGQFEAGHIKRPHVPCAVCGRIVVDVSGQMARHMKRFHPDVKAAADA